jgi:hypothetical protein
LSRKASDVIETVPGGSAAGVAGIEEPAVLSGCDDVATAAVPAVLLMLGVVGTVPRVVPPGLPALPLMAAVVVGCVACAGAAGGVGETVAMLGCAADCGVEPACIAGTAVAGAPDVTAEPRTSPHAASKPTAHKQNDGRGFMAA